MQQAGHKQHLAVHPLIQNTAGDRQFFDQFMTLDLRQGRDHLNGMLIHGIAVIHIELHHRDDRGKFRDESPQDIQFIHAPQSALGIAVFQHQIEENPIGLGVAPHVVVNQVQIAGDHPHRIGVQQIPRAQGLLENAQ